MPSGKPIPFHRMSAQDSINTYEMKPVIGYGDDRLGLVVINLGDRLCIDNSHCRTPITVPTIAPWRAK
jgi:hypothetical protein